MKPPGQPATPKSSGFFNMKMANAPIPQQAKKKIAALIAAGYALALVLVVVLGLAAISGMEGLSAISKTLYEHPFKAANAALEAQAAIAQTRDRMLLIVLFDDPQKIAEWSAEMAAFDKDARERLDVVKASFIGDSLGVEKTTALLKQWQEARDQAIQVSLRGQRGETAQQVVGNSLKLFKQTNDRLDYVIAAAKRKAVAFVAESEKKAADEINRVIEFLVVLAATIGFVGWLVVRRVMALVRGVERLERDLLGSEHKAQSAAYVRSLIEASLDPLVTISPHGKIADVNRATEQVTGRERDELIGTDFADYFTEPGKAREGYQKVFLDGAVIDYPLAIRHREGRVTEVLYNASLYRDEAGNVSGVFAAARDMTEHNRLAREKEQYFRFFMLSPDPMGIADPFGCFRHVNPAFAHLTGYTEGELLARPFLEFIVPEDRQKTVEEMRLQVSTRPSYHFENRYLCKDGRVLFLVWTAYYDKNDGVTYSTAHDHTEFKEAEERLRESEKKFKVMTDTSPLAIYMSTGVEQKAEYVNPRFTELFGYTLEEVPTVAQWWPLAYPDETYRRQVSEEWQRRVERAIKTSSAIEPMEVVVTCKDGSKKNISWGYISSGTQNWAFGLDLTERTQAEDALREKEERLALATLKNGVGVWDWNLQTQEMIWDDSMYELYHIRREDFIGTEEAWRAALHPDDLARGDREVADAIADRKPFETEFRVVWPNGEIRHIKAVAKVFRDGDGTPLRMLGINMDVTDRKQAEEKIHQINAELERRVMERTAQLEAANKELEAFSYSVSHDLRTPLRAIDGFSQMLLEDYADTLDAEGKRLLNVVRNNTSRMSQLIDDILRFSRAGRAEMLFTKIDMDRLVRDVLDGLMPLLAARNVQFQLGHLPNAVGDRAMLRQVVENLLSNAIKFSGKKADASIEIGGRLEGGNAVYYVKDNGVGFNMQYAGKLFGVFQRLHGVEEFDGTGIGLAIVKRLIARHGGTVWAEGEVGHGAAFYFSIPLNQGEWK